MQKENKITDLDLIFGDFCTEIFKYKTQIVQKTENPDPKIIYKNLAAKIKEILDHQKSITFELQVREVVYIMVSLADEIFLNIPWDGKKYWEDNMLEKHFFGTQIAGEKIFTNIDKLIEKNDVESILIAEIYTKALSLGFRGKYRDDAEQDKPIDVYRKNLFNFVERFDKSINMISHRMFSKEYIYTLPTINRQFLPDVSIVNYVYAFVIFMFLVISTVVWLVETRDLHEILQEISAIVLRA
ncbi:MAG: DotU family type IV/VI secretion system protein [Alphaproteobacteria bacterium]|nr:DotU family type IV/VI secretion system protein [Alphaproteobacteria bacterium]